MGSIQLRVDDTFPEGIRLDKYCTFQEGAISRSRLKGGLLDVTVNGKPSKLSRMVRPGDEILISWADPAPKDLQAEEIPLDILFENERVTLVNKAQGMVTHPAAGNWSGTLVNALLHHWKKEGPPGQGFRPGIVHRLDKDTSGLIITARDYEAETFLQEAFKSRTVTKIYAAILCGVPRENSGEIRTRIYRDPKNRQRYICTDDPQKGRMALTDYQVRKVYGPYSLVLFRLRTGRTHQLRVHSKFIGCPILGDPIYGRKDKLFPEATLMLHSRRLELLLPGDTERRSFESPLPVRFRQVLARLVEMYGNAGE